MDMRTMGGSPVNGPMGVGSPQDVRNHPAVKLPAPGHSPAVVHGTGMAGSVLGITGKVNSMQSMR